MGLLVSPIVANIYREAFETEPSQQHYTPQGYGRGMLMIPLWFNTIHIKRISSGTSTRWTLPSSSLSMNPRKICSVIWGISYLKTLFQPGGNAQNGLILHVYWFLDMLIPMAQVLRQYIQMFLSYGLYVCITLATAHHRTTFRIFCNITQKTIPEENSKKMFHISSLNLLFSYGKVKDIFRGIRIKFHLRRTKGRGKRAIFSSSSWSKTTLCILRNKYGFPIGNAMEKTSYFDQE